MYFIGFKNIVGANVKATFCIKLINIQPPTKYVFKTRFSV